MRLREFLQYKLMKRRYTLLTIILLLTISLIFTVTLNGLLSITISFKNYVGGKDNIIVLFDAYSRTPFTGSLDIRVVEEINSLDGVKVVSPEVLVPIYLNRSSVLLRGVHPDIDPSILEINVIKGGYLDEDDIYRVLIGDALAERLDISEGDILLARGILRNTYHILKVGGIFTSNPPYNEEVIAHIDLAREFRGFTQNSISIIRVELMDNVYPDKKSVLNKLQRLIEEASSDKGYLSSDKLRTASVEEFVTYYMDKIGIDPYTLLMIPGIILILLSYTIKYLVTGMVSEHSDIFRIIHWLGLSTKDIKKLFFIKLLPYIGISSLFGYILGYLFTYIIWSHSPMRFIIHLSLTQLNILVPIIIFIILGSVTALYIHRSEEVIPYK